MKSIIMLISAGLMVCSAGINAAEASLAQVQNSCTNKQIANSCSVADKTGVCVDAKQYGMICDTRQQLPK